MSTTTISPVITPYVSLRIHPKYATSRSLTEIIFHSRKGTVFPTRDSGHWIWVTLVNRFSSDSACTDRLRSRSSITHEKGHACLLGSAVSDVLSPLWTQSHMNLKITFSFSISTAEIVEVSWQTYVVTRYTYWCTASGGSFARMTSQSRPTLKSSRPIRSSSPRTGRTSNPKRQDSTTTSGRYNSRKMQTTLRRRGSRMRRRQIWWPRTH